VETRGQDRIHDSRPRGSQNKRSFGWIAYGAEMVLAGLVLDSTASLHNAPAIRSKSKSVELRQTDLPERLQRKPCFIRSLVELEGMIAISSAVTVIRFSVRVPVLSEQMTVTEPRVRLRATSG